MLKALKITIIVVAAAVAVLLVAAATRPDSFRVERSIVIKAPAERIYGHIADFRAWPAWSPWEKKDPALKRQFDGPASGRGASYAWEGNQEVGSGRMEITEVTPPSKVTIDLRFLKPMAARNTAEFTLQGGGENAGTRVTWAMHGPAPFLTKLMDMVFGLDRMVGPDFETGLANLKAVAEKPPVDIVAPSPAS